MDESMILLVLSVLQVVSRRRRTLIQREFLRQHMRARRMRMTRQRTVVTFLMTVLANFYRDRNRNSDSSMSPRRWIVPRSTNWWDDIVPGWNDYEWIRNFRMNKDMFIVLTGHLRQHIQRRDTNFRLAIPVNKRLAICLWRLETNCEIRTISHLFGVGYSTVCEIVLEICHTLSHHFLSEYVQWPNQQEMLIISQGFLTRTGFPDVVGLIDGSHVPIVAPHDDHTDYYNRKSYYSISIQGVVDHNYMFRDVVYGWPGSVHDARVFSQSAFYRKGRAGLMKKANKDDNYVILGDSAYPLLGWLVKPFPDVQMTPQQKLFNKVHSSTRVAVEHAFGRLKGRFRILGKRLDCALEHVPDIIGACLTLHNFVERGRQPYICGPAVEEFEEPGATANPAHSEVGLTKRDKIKELLWATRGN